MRFTVVLVLLFAIVMATMAKKVNQKKMNKWKKKFQAEKMQRQQQAACEIVTWSSCENGTITQSVSPNTSNPDCKGAIIDTTTISHTMDCVANITKQFKACKLVISRNFTACGLGEDFYNMTKTFDCKKKSHKNNKAPAQRPCGVHITDKVNMKKGKGKKGKGGGGKVKLNSKRREKKVFRKKMKQLEGQGCEYQRQSCVGKKMKYTLLQGNQNKCDKELLGPCLGVFRSKKNKARSGRGGKQRKRA